MRAVLVSLVLISMVLVCGCVGNGSNETSTTYPQEMRLGDGIEMRIDGVLAVKGSEMNVTLGEEGTLIQKSADGYLWFVSITLSDVGAKRLGESGVGKRGRPLDIFMDRPRNTTILMTSDKYSLLSNVTSTSTQDSLYYGGTALDVITNRSAIPVVVYSTDENKTLGELIELKKDGFNSIYIAGTEVEISDYFKNTLEENGLNTYRKTQGNLSYEQWVKELTGIYSSPRLAFDTQGESIYQLQITGKADTEEEAKKEINKIKFCYNGIQDEGESDVDCGGNCMPCKS